MRDIGAEFDFASGGRPSRPWRDTAPGSCRSPPFAEWALDFANNRAAYGGPDAPPLAPSRAAVGAVTVALVDFLSDRGEPWVAALEVRELDQLWTGTVRFHRPDSAATCRTGPILREEDPEGVRARFEAFDRTTLSALLRSALP